MTDLFLADVARYQGEVDWAAYAAWSPAAICKATGGTATSGGSSRVDPLFTRNQALMRAHLEVRGFYHFLQVGHDPIKQAHHFASTVGELRPGEFAVLDVETDANHAAHEAFAAKVDELLGGVCWLYGGQQLGLNRRPTWVARYYNDKPDPKGEPRLPHVLWQYTSTGSAPGIAGNVDLNVHRGDIGSLRRHALQGACMATVADDLRKVLNEGTAQGQTTWAGTAKATLAAIQTVTNEVRVVAGQVANAVAGIARLATDLRGVDAKVAALDAKLTAATTTGTLPDLSGVVAQAVKDGRVVSISIQPTDGG